MMEKKKNNYPWGPIRNFLAVLFSGVFTAVIFALFMLYYYGPTGSYTLGNVLLSPETITKLSFEDSDQPGRNSPRYQYDHIEYANWNAENKQWQRVDVSPGDYQHFYESIAQEKSILEVPHEIVNLFYSIPPSKLTIFVRNQADNPTQKEISKPMQVAEFSNEGNYYRIELRSQEGSGGWAYFHRPKIREEAKALFFRKSQVVK